MSTTTLWLDCSSGIAGDMLAGALIDAGADRMAMERALASLPVEGYTICVSHVERASVRCCDFDVVLQPGLETHDHDMDRLFGDLDRVDPIEDHAYGHRHGHAHAHRTLGDVLQIIEGADLTEGARSIARRAFFILADAEAEAHGKTRETVRFHEVGAIDSIVDVVACSVLADSIGADRVCVTSLTEGSGRIRTAHGVMPIPVPAVAAVLRAYDVPVRISPVEGELITPTGAALVATLATDFQAPANLALRGVGYGAGKRDYPWANYVRAIVGSEDPHAPAASAALCGAMPQGEGSILKLECEVDDVTGEAMGVVIERLMDAGAREAHWIPLGTKKGRPAWQLQAICMPEDREALELVIFRDTTTIGIRRSPMERTVLAREELTVEAELAQGQTAVFRAKRSHLPDGSVRVMPEADDVARISAERGLPLQRVWQATLAACSDLSR